MRRILSTVGVLLAAFGLMLGLSSSAQAASDGPTLCAGGSCVWFDHDGDKIFVRDSDEDGHSAIAQVCAPSGSCTYAANYLWNHGGYNTTLSYGYGTQIPEGTAVYYRPCYGEWNGGGGKEDVVWCNPGWTHGVA
ncbi:hypothetical protein [Streptomyces lincolnensis]|uniref:hypothetical protein n=1 Tax=Streptomyces lincolnensis TaxID=1915 RepID=UPI0012603696|nr:hypothetical protein [Streptomyces lincolnensis]QMV09685.1 hypothetical protein GJU35_31215 [Streptomyces lincolnensis]